MKCLNVFSAGLIFSLIFARLGLAQVDDASLVKTIQTLAASREPAKMISAKVRIFALYANGEYWVNPDVAPQHLNPVKAKQAHPKQWGSWRKSGNQIWITDHKGKQEKLPGFRIAPIRVGTKLHGAWYNENVGSVAIGSSSGYWSASKTIRFNSAGRFDAAKRQTTASTTTSSGSQTGTYGNRNQPTQTGRYQFNGYTVNLNYDNGQSEWLLSYAIDKDNDPYNRIMINDREYTHQ